MESLALTDSVCRYLQSAWQSIPSFPALREIEVPVAILSTQAFQDTSSIRHAIFKCLWDDEEVDHTVLPNLEEVTCFPEDLEVFLPSDGTENRRPIKTVTLNHARYERSTAGGYHCVDNWYDLGDWVEVICSALDNIHFSAAALTRLSLVVEMLCVDSLSGLLPLLKELEYLLIMLKISSEDVRTSNPAVVILASDFAFHTGQDWSDSDDIFEVAKVFLYMPRLHTFWLSDGPAKTSKQDGRPFYFAHDEDYQHLALAVYDGWSSSLRRVAFTSEFEWEKREDGWYPWGHVAAEREIVSDGEDDDP